MLVLAFAVFFSSSSLRDLISGVWEVGYPLLVPVGRRLTFEPFVGSRTARERKPSVRSGQPPQLPHFERTVGSKLRLHDNSATKPLPSPANQLLCSGTVSVGLEPPPLQNPSCAFPFPCFFPACC